jgi:hypothetical protein
MFYICLPFWSIPARSLAHYWRHGT